jgi:hypothetical protein
MTGRSHTAGLVAAMVVALGFAALVLASAQRPELRGPAGAVSGLGLVCLAVATWRGYRPDAFVWPSPARLVGIAAGERRAGRRGPGGDIRPAGVLGSGVGA